MKTYILTTDNGGNAEYIYGIIAENDEEALRIYKESDVYLRDEPDEAVEKDNDLYKIHSDVYGTVFVSVFELKLKENECICLGGYED